MRKIDLLLLLKLIWEFAFVFSRKTLLKECLNRNFEWFESTHQQTEFFAIN